MKLNERTGDTAGADAAGSVAMIAANPGVPNAAKPGGNPASAGAGESAPQPGLGTRAVALATLLGTAGALAWLIVSVVQIFTDAWIAPISLSPDSDAVLSLNLELTRQRSQVALVEHARGASRLERVGRDRVPTTEHDVVQTGDE